LDENPSVGPASHPQTTPTPAPSLTPTTSSVPKMHPSREALLPGPSRPPLIPGFPLGQLPATVGGLPVGIPPGLRPPFASGPGYPLLSHPHPFVQPEDEPNLKKQKTETGGAEGASLIPEKQFISENPGPVTVSIALPTVDKEKGSSWNLAGQTLKITMNLTESVGKLKVRRQRLSSPRPHFLFLLVLFFFLFLLFFFFFFQTLTRLFFPLLKRN
jgi:hypothetical protein